MKCKSEDLRKKTGDTKWFSSCNSAANCKHACLLNPQVFSVSLTHRLVINLYHSQYPLSSVQYQIIIGNVRNII
jgi:hypothetical protein